MFNINVAVGLCTAIIVLPALGYIFWGRPYRRRMILGYFTPHSIADYFDQFWAGNARYGELTTAYNKARQSSSQSDDTARAAKDLSEALLNLYNSRFGWLAYAVPFAVLVMILYIEAGLVVQ